MANLFSLVACFLLTLPFHALPEDEETCSEQRGEVARSLLQSLADGSFRHAGPGKSPTATEAELRAGPWPYHHIKRCATALKDWFCKKEESKKKKRKPVLNQTQKKKLEQNRNQTEGSIKGSNDAKKKEEAIMEEGVHFLKGCKHVFFDLGANRGTHVRKLFEPEKYPQSSYLKVFDDAFGNGTSRKRSFKETGICAVGFEPNPRWSKNLTAIEKAYTKKGWKVHFFTQMAVGSETTTVGFFLNDYKGDNQDMGFGIKKRQSWAEPINITTLDVAAYISKALENTDDGYKLIKMDIEATEYSVLPNFLERKLLCKTRINEITIEWHDRLLDETGNKMATELRKNISNFMENKCGGTGKGTNVHEFDDESYYDVDKPLPHF